MRVAAIDCGTNSLRLLIGDVDPAEASPRDVLRRTEIVRLGEGVDSTGTIAPEAMGRALRVCGEYARECDAHGVQAVRFVATSAARDARNAAEFVAGVRAAFRGRAVTPQVIDGAREAALSFAGATGPVTAAGHPAPYLVVDLGGGSTEFVRGDAAPEAALSVDIGSVRLTERLLGSDPPSRADVESVERAVDAALDRVAAAVDLRGVGTLVGLAGTVTTLTAYVLGLESYADRTVDLAVLDPAVTAEVCARLVAMPRAERAALPVMVPGREDVIAAGAIVWARIVRRVAEASPGVTLVTSVHDILDGLVLELAGELGGSTAAGAAP